MNILWIPHTPIGTTRTRTEHLIENLSSRHRIDVLDFRMYDRRQYLRYFTDLIHRRKVTQTYGVRYLPLWRFPGFKLGNSLLLNWTLSSAIRKWRYDVIVLSATPYLIGEPDFGSFGIPIVCDYLDGADWALYPPGRNFEKYFVENADRVICVSRRLLRQALTVNKRSSYVPNGVNVRLYAEYPESRSQSKKRLGISPETIVVSVIGLTFSSRLYFIDAVMDLIKDGYDLILLLVGDGPLLPKVRAYAKGAEDFVRVVGKVDYSDILPYFAASDIGLYPVDDHSYFHSASPLKVFEYSAMGIPVIISPRLEEMAEVELPTFHFCEDNSASLKAAIKDVINSGKRFKDAVPWEFDWANLAKRIEDVLLEAAADRHVRSDTTISQPSGV